eukprot:838021-Ditylum_brightwellii.AAC.1
MEKKDFNDMDAYLDTRYDRLLPGSVNCSQIFTVDKSEPPVLKVQDCNESVFHSKDLMKGNISNQIHELKKMGEKFVALEPPGLRHTNQVEMYSTFWLCVADEYKDETCQNPAEHVTKDV